MKFKYAFEKVNLGDEIIMVPVGEKANQVHGVIKANETGDRIIQLLMQGMTEEDAINTLLKECDNDRETIEGYVRTIIGFLQDNHIVE